MIDSKMFYKGGYRNVQPGDFIRCRDKEDASDVAADLKSFGFKYGFVSIVDGRPGHFVKVSGRRTRVGEEQDE